MYRASAITATCDALLHFDRTHLSQNRHSNRLLDDQSGQNRPRLAGVTDDNRIRKFVSLHSRERGASHFVSECIRLANRVEAHDELVERYTGGGFTFCGIDAAQALDDTILREGVRYHDL